MHVTCQRPICSAEKVQFNSCRISQRQLPNTKSKHKFSTLAHDRVREQLNAIVKGDGGIIGITNCKGCSVGKVDDSRARNG